MFFSQTIFKNGRIGGVVKTALFSVLFLSFASGANAANGPIGGPGPAIVGGGGNLTGYSGNAGAQNNNQWNQMMNPNRGSADAPRADFGNCNAVIMRCASPKCPGGGCVDMNIAMTIVNGCVQSNASCKQYGDELVGYISAQLVANATNRAQAADAQAQMAAAAQSAAAQSASDAAAMNAVQAQMQQMQQQMEQQSREAQQQIADALSARDAADAARAAAATPTTAAASNPNSAGASLAMESAIAQGVSADIIARNQASGRILSQLENVRAALANVKKTMQDTFEYAGCDTRGENCTGPKRVAVFKQKASAFFDPFETVQDEVYDALIQAQALGVDISDIYMMLSSSCNVWGQYLCESGQKLRYLPYSDKCDDSKNNNAKCPPSLEWGGKIVPMGQGGCQLLRTLNSGETVFQSWLDIPTNEDKSRTTAVACASDALDTSKFFANRRKKIDDVGIDDLAIVLSADAYVPTNGAPDESQLKRCNVMPYGGSQGLANMLMSGRFGGEVTTSTPPAATSGSVSSSSLDAVSRATVGASYDAEKSACEKTGGKWMSVYCSCPAGQIVADDKTKGCQSETIRSPVAEANYSLAKFACEKDGIWDSRGLTCICGGAKSWNSSAKRCEERAGIEIPKMDYSLTPKSNNTYSLGTK